MDQRTDLIKAILKLEKVKVANDAIQTYSDFLKYRDFIVYHQFNPHVFEGMVDVALSVWTSNRKVNRLSLMTTIKRYFTDQNVNLNSLHSVAIKKIFQLYAVILENKQILSANQLPLIEKLASQLIYGVEFKQEELDKLCELATKDDKALNRILRYPVRSIRVSSWIREQFDTNLLRLRRAEAVGWMLDSQSDFEVSIETLKADFEFVNQLDQAAIENAVMTNAIDLLMTNEWEELFPPNVNYFEPIPNEVFDNWEKEKSLRKFKPKARPEFVKRFYPVPTMKSEQFDDWVPDFNSLNEFFEKNHLNLLKVTMIWGVAYSRLDKKTKVKLLKKYYAPETHYSVYRVAKKLELLDLLKWMVERLG
jgi:hypothetical protein